MSLSIQLLGNMYFILITRRGRNAEIIFSAAKTISRKGKV